VSYQCFTPAASLAHCKGNAKGQGQVLPPITSAINLSIVSTKDAEDAHAGGRWAGLVLAR